MTFLRVGSAAGVNSPVIFLKRGIGAPKIKICHMAAKEHPKVIEGRQWLISVDFLCSEELAEDAFIDHGAASPDEEGGSGLVGEGVTE